MTTSTTVPAKAQGAISVWPGQKRQKLTSSMLPSLAIGTAQATDARVPRTASPAYRWAGADATGDSVHVRKPSMGIYVDFADVSLHFFLCDVLQISNFQNECRPDFTAHVLLHLLRCQTCTLHLA